jgi:hypothetical protein
MSRKTPNNPLTPEWSLKVDVAQLGGEAVRIALTSTPEQRKDLARRMKVNALEALEGEVLIQRRPGSHIIHVKGQVKANVSQSCVVTLEPILTPIDEKIEAWYSDEDRIISLSRARREQQGMRADAELEIAGEEEDPEPVIDGAIDVGELAAQYLSLAIDPYPRCEAARKAENEGETIIRAGSRPNPFAALKDWKAGRDKKK